jgi:hypothetical protein
LWDITASSPLPSSPSRHKTIHVGKPKHPIKFPTSSFLDFNGFPSPTSLSLGKRRKLAKHGGRRRGGGEEGEEGDVVDIFPDEELNDQTWNGEASSPIDIHTHHDTYYQNRGSIVTGFGNAENYSGMEVDSVTDETDYNEEEGGVVGVYNSTPEFLAVVPVSNSCVSFVLSLPSALLSFYPSQFFYYT